MRFRRFRESNWESDRAGEGDCVRVAEIAAIFQTKHRNRERESERVREGEKVRVSESERVRE